MILGMDLGSRSVKFVLMDKNEKIVEKKIYDTVKFYREFGKKDGETLKVNLEEMGVKEVSQIVSTGYGRNNIKVNNGKVLSELKAHYIGSLKKVNFDTYTLLDIGGQDTKVIRVEKGFMTDFITNDKCAAGSGRYLENMANILGVSIEELAKYHKEPVSLNNTCAIFGESELIGKIAEGESLENLCAGVNYSVFKRTDNYLKKYPQDKLVFSGGVSKNIAIRTLIEENTEFEIYNLENSQYNGAIGCCYYGLK